MLSKKNLMVTMVTDEFLENRIILQKSVATIGFIWFFWFQKCILLYIFVQIFLEMRCIRSHISFFRLGLTPTLNILGQSNSNIPCSFWNAIEDDDTWAQVCFYDINSKTRRSIFILNYDDHMYCFIYVQNNCYKKVIYSSVFPVISALISCWSCPDIHIRVSFQISNLLLIHCIDLFKSWSSHHFKHLELRNVT